MLKAVVVSMQQQLLAEHGGSPGIRDEGLLDSALARPLNLYSYQPDATIFDLAATYGHGLCRNHAFVDGNKRVALVATAVFLRINGVQLVADEASAALTFEALASGDLDLQGLCSWLERSSTTLSSKP